MTTSQNNNTIFAYLDSEVNSDTSPLCFGANGAVEHTIHGMAGTNSQTKGALTALYAGLTRGASRARVKELFDNVYNSAKQLGDKVLQNSMACTFVIALQKRDCRGGDGEKDLSRWLLLELWYKFPKSVTALIPLFPEFGYWKDHLLFIKDLEDEFATVQSLTSRSRKYKKGEHPLINSLYQSMVEQLQEDLETYHAYQKLIQDKTPEEMAKIPKPTISLLAKWTSKEGSSHDKKYGSAKVLARLHSPELFEENRYKAMKKYRQDVSLLNEVINTTERLMSLNRWDEIQWRLVPGKCLQKHRRAFLNLVGGSKCKTQDERSTDEKRRECRRSLLEFMELAAAGKAQVKGKTLHIHEIINKFGVQSKGRNRLSPEEKLLLELQWKTKRDELIKMIKEEQLDINQFVVMSDFSDSMKCRNGVPLQVSMAFGIMLSEVMEGPFANRILSFSENPSWIVFREDMSLEEKIQHALDAAWGGSTNYLRAHDMILALAIKHRLKPEQMPKGFLTVSDMQFNQPDASSYGCYATRGNRADCHFDVLQQYANMTDLRQAFQHKTTYGYRTEYTSNLDTIHQVLVQTYEAVGKKVCGQPYTLGRAVYWNVNGDTNGFPVQSDTPNTQLVSGFTVEMIKLVFQGKYALDVKDPPTPWQLLVDIISQERYHPVLLSLQATKETLFHDFQAPTPPSNDDNDDLVMVNTPDTLQAELQTITSQMGALHTSGKKDPDTQASITSIQNRIQEIMKALSDPSIYTN